MNYIVFIIIGFLFLAIGTVSWCYDHWIEVEKTKVVAQVRLPDGTLISEQYWNNYESVSKIIKKCEVQGGGK